MKHTAGIWAFRKKSKRPEVLLVHPGGPFYKKKDHGVWSVPKGEYDPANENAFEVALREFEEETGNRICAQNFISLSPVKTKGGKLLTSWAVETDFAQAFISSNTFELEFPPRSGKIEVFPETDDADWFSFDEAALKLNASQLPVLKELEELLNE